MIPLFALWTFLRALLFGSAVVALENLALRHQLAVLQRSIRRPRLSRWDRVLWVWLYWVWAGWRSNLVIVQPATVLTWHRQGFQVYWRWKASAIEMRFTTRCSPSESRAWEFERFGSPHARPGRIPSWSDSSPRFAARASATSSS
jgi:hypothetical protein